MDLDTSYEVARVAEFIRSHRVTRVALQFPDELLKDSMTVVKALRRELSSPVQLYVMADTTYGSCCVDEVGAAHINAECVIHYGHTCLSPTSVLSALFIFGKASIDASNCSRHIHNCALQSGKPVLVLYGLEYAHAISDIEKALVSKESSLSGSMLEYIYADVSCSAMNPSKTFEPANQLEFDDTSAINKCFEQTSQNYSIGGLSWILPQGRRMEDYLVIWIGLDNPAFANVVLTFNNCEIVRYDAENDCMMTDLSTQKKILRRRYYLVEKAKDANMIGILVGTLGTAGYLHMIHQMRDLIAKAGKKSYTFVMGKPNPAKLANFPECDVFINVSCPQTALLDSKEFLAPIITPFEATLALDRGEWTGVYVTEFRDLIDSTLPIAKKHSEEARFSFFQGGYVEDMDLQDNNDVEKDEILALVSTTEKALQLRDSDDTRSLLTAKSGAEYFANRSYHGLDINSTSSLPGEVLSGRSGRASGYTNEKNDL
ncbi:uncharacterized protein LOC127260635 isoform X2 [Andrographis paniculata]|uniref:uncharacterized protein LOC127260635 isoform X2 n=1 Tax=Andrographis paniculata TaxID=175694 RepID=UPI0021E92B06|nr:uncharacterized protein LOC127260635 isoform X2 [Andrographis paniculata]